MDSVDGRASELIGSVKFFVSYEDGGTVVEGSGGG